MKSTVTTFFTGREACPARMKLLGRRVFHIVGIVPIACRLGVRCKPGGGVLWEGAALRRKRSSSTGPAPIGLSTNGRFLQNILGVVGYLELQHIEKPVADSYHVSAVTRDIPGDSKARCEIFLVRQGRQLAVRAANGFQYLVSRVQGLVCLGIKSQVRYVVAESEIQSQSRSQFEIILGVAS